MWCQKCNAERSSRLTFCPVCGDKMIAEEPSELYLPEPKKSLSGTHSGRFPYQVSLDKHKELQRGLRKMAWPIAALAPIVMLVAIAKTGAWKMTSVENDLIFYLVLSALGVVWLWYGTVNSGLTKDEYLSIPYAKNNDGETRCIFCGCGDIELTTKKQTFYEITTAQCANGKCACTLYSDTSFKG